LYLATKALNNQKIRWKTPSKGRAKCRNL